jgi:hypothetical protein
MEEQERVRQRADALIRRIGETCDELERLAEENPELVGRVTRGAEEHKDAYLRLKARLELADAAPRCRWVRQDGTGCQSPQMKKHIYCFAHRQMMEARALALSLPAQEDANAIQIGIMRIQKALIEDTISTKKAGLLLYSMQLALQNVGQTTFGQAKAQEAVRETVDEEEAFSSQHSAIGQNQHQKQRPFTTEDTKDTEEEKSSNQNLNLFTAKPLHGAVAEGAKEENQGSPLMNQDDCGLEDRPKQVAWKPTPDMYRTDTPEGREAYEAMFRIKIVPELDGQRRQAHAVIASQPAQERTQVVGLDGNAEVHAVLG